MPINSRQKGASGEREFIAELKEWLGDMADGLKRNLEQTREGGHDIVGLGNWALEVKRYAKASDGLIARWWEQAVEQAGNDRIPVLAYREDRQEWRIRIPIGIVTPSVTTSNDLAWTIEVSPELFAAIVREFSHV